MPIVKTFRALQDQYVEITLYKDIVRHLSMGETVAPITFGGKACRVLSGGIGDVLPKSGEVTLYMDRTGTQLTPEGPSTDVIGLSGVIEKFDETTGIIQLRSKSIKGESMRVHVKQHDVLFISSATPLLAVTELSASDEKSGAIFELEGVADPKRHQNKTPPRYYIPSDRVSWVTERIGLTLVGA